MNDFSNSLSKTLQETATTAASTLGAAAREALDHNQEAVKAGKEAVHDLATTVQREALAAGERTQRYVRDEPVKAMLMAAAAGAALTGLLMAAKRR